MWSVQITFRKYLFFDCTYNIELKAMFAAQRFYGKEASWIKLYLKLSGNGTSSKPFNVTVTPSEQSPVSAEGNSVMCVLLCVDWRMFD